MVDSSNPMLVIPSNMKVIFKEHDLALNHAVEKDYLFRMGEISQSLSLWQREARVCKWESSPTGKFRSCFCRMGVKRSNNHDWLLNSMELSIAEGFLFLDSVKEIWDAAVEIYGEKENLVCLSVAVRSSKISERRKGILRLLNHLKMMWDELQQHHPFTPDLETIKKRDKENRVFKLLAGLRKDFKTIRP